MAPIRWPEQPARTYLQRERYSIPLAAQTIGVPESHLRNVLYGRTRPMEQVKTGLSELLGIPVEKLFTPEVLEKPYNPIRNPWKPIDPRRVTR